MDSTKKNDAHIKNLELLLKTGNVPKKRVNGSKILRIPQKYKN